MSQKSTDNSRQTSQDVNRIPIIIRDNDLKETHYVFLRRPTEQVPYNAIVSFTATNGDNINHRIPIKHDTLGYDMSVKGRFITINSVDYLQDKEKLAKTLAKEALYQKMLGKEMNKRSPNRSQSPSPNTKSASLFRQSPSRLSRVVAGGGGHRFGISTRKMT